MKNVITVTVTIPTELDILSVHQQIVYALEDYIDNKASNPKNWQIEINGQIWNACGD